LPLTIHPRDRLPRARGSAAADRAGVVFNCLRQGALLALSKRSRRLRLRGIQLRHRLPDFFDPAFDVVFIPDEIPVGLDNLFDLSGRPVASGGDPSGAVGSRDRLTGAVVCHGCEHAGLVGIFDPVSERIVFVFSKCGDYFARLDLKLMRLLIF